MKKVNKKKLNNKGFTLVELLAVVVILAIVMGIAATSVLNSINNSRISTLYSTAQNAANTLNTWISEDMLVTDNAKKKLGDTFIKKSQTGSWICLGHADIKNINNGGSSAELIKALGFSTNDIVTGSTFTKETIGGTNPKDPTCSAIKYNKSTGGYEIVLVAKLGGKYYVSSDANHFAYSRATGPNTANID